MINQPLKYNTSTFCTCYLSYACHPMFILTLIKITSEFKFLSKNMTVAFEMLPKIAEVYGDAHT